MPMGPDQLFQSSSSCLCLLPSLLLVIVPSPLVLWSVDCLLLLGLLFDLVVF